MRKIIIKKKDLIIDQFLLKRGSTMNNLHSKKIFNILLIEDNPADVRMIQEIFKEFKTKTKLYTVNNGIDALKFLNKEERYENKSDIDLILLDLNIPLINGFEVLENIKNNHRLKDISIFVLTTSPNQEDFFKAYELNANCFMAKPSHLEDYHTLLRHIEESWII
jgi:FOG: CheY-like receiver